MKKLVQASGRLEINSSKGVGTDCSLKFVYIARSTLPSHSANAVNVIKMSSAVARQSVDVLLVAYFGGQRDLAQVLEPYGVGPSIIYLNLLPRMHFPGGGHIFALSAIRSAWAAGAEIIYTRCPQVALWAGRLRFPHILELHHLSQDRKTSVRLRRVLESSYLQALVVISDALKRDVVHRYKPANIAIHVLRDAADPVSPSLEPLLPPSPRGRIGYAGSFAVGKGIDTVLAVAQRLPQYDFMIAGGGEEEVAEFRSGVGGGANLHFMGRLPHCDVAAFLLSCDVLLLPNGHVVRTPGGGDLDIGKWTSPLKAFEYMAAAKPIVASRTAALSEIFRDGENAVLCEAGATEEWARAIERLMENAVIRKSLSEAALEEFLANYTWDARAARVLDILRSNEQPLAPGRRL